LHIGTIDAGAWFFTMLEVDSVLGGIHKVASREAGGFVFNRALLLGTGE
jgi:hypothetical protein